MIQREILEESSIPPELLAPAGSQETFIGALAAGADAVYLGGRRFGARHFAANFDDSALDDAVTYAHHRGVKVYVTVNTLIHDNELSELAQYLEFLFIIGVDGILIQDMGVLTLAQDLFAGLSHAPALHASTQMAIHNLEGACYGAMKGCSRIVLARELPAGEICEIAKVLSHLGSEVEIFVHGALCYAYSGQCLMSSIIGGRSGNRGMCAQPCRKPYTLIKGTSDQYGRMCDGKPVPLTDEYLLSTRDLSLYPVLNKITALPVSALKIEGRMRSPVYVTTVTDVYRRAIDSCNTEIFHPLGEEETDLILAFSRGFTTGYVNNQSYETVMGRNLPGNRGILIGTVTISDHLGKLTITPASDIVPRRGDGLVCIGDSFEEGFILRNDSFMKGRILEMEAGIRCRKGDLVYLTSRGRIARSAKALMQDPDKRYLGSIQIDLQITIQSDGIVTLFGTVQLRSGTIIPFSFISESILSPARSKPLSCDQIAAAINKTGGTLYNLRALQVTCSDGLFAPVSILNGIRREMLEKITAEIGAHFKPSPDDIRLVHKRIGDLMMKIPNSSDNQSSDIEPNKREPGLVVIVSDITSLHSALNGGADRVYIEWYPAEYQSDCKDAIKGSESEPKNLHGSGSSNGLHETERADDYKGIINPSALISLKEITDMIILNPDYTARIGIKLPKIVRRADLDSIYSSLPTLITAGIRLIMTDGIGIAEAISSYSDSFLCAGYAGLNIANHLSLMSYTGYDFLTLSCELSGKEIDTTMRAARLAQIQTPIALIGQGLLEVMVTEDRIISLAGNNTSSSKLYGIKDNKNQIFSIISDPTGRTHVFNAAETSLIEYIPEIKHAGIGFIIIDARWRGSLYTDTMISIWRNALATPTKDWNRQIIDRFKSEIKQISAGGLTSATWKRGLS